MFIKMRTLNDAKSRKTWRKSDEEIGAEQGLIDHVRRDIATE